jgi:23S rRNA pseudouridine1911/1915/1917 synthase
LLVLQPAVGSFGSVEQPANDSAHATIRLAFPETDNLKPCIFTFQSAGSPKVNVKKIISTPPSTDDDVGTELVADAEVLEFVVPIAEHGMRLDKCLSNWAAGLSRSYLQQLIIEGCVQVNQNVVTKQSNGVKAGDACRVHVKPTEQARSFVAQPMALDVVFEDDHLMVINKPAGLVVHPAAGNWTGTLLNGLLHHHAGAAVLPRAGIVHRLDKDTSGLMVVAKTRRAMDALVDLIAARELTRLYLAVTGGVWSGVADVKVDAAIGRDPANRLRMAVVPRSLGGGKPSQTQFALLTSGQEASLVACKLFTGRTHQIRVHLAALKNPILGDSIYKGRQHPSIQRQALHAARLSFTHPVTQALLDVQSPLPADMVEACAQHGVAYNPRSLCPDLFRPDAPTRSF